MSRVSIRRKTKKSENSVVFYRSQMEHMLMLSWLENYIREMDQPRFLRALALCLLLKTSCLNLFVSSSISVKGLCSIHSLSVSNIFCLFSTAMAAALFSSCCRSASSYENFSISNCRHIQLHRYVCIDACIYHIYASCHMIMWTLHVDHQMPPLAGMILDWPNRSQKVRACLSWSWCFLLILGYYYFKLFMYNVKEQCI